jgi:hypothetical protein
MPSLVTAKSKNTSAILHFLLSLLAVAGAGAGYHLWSWQRHHHWGEGVLWASSGVIGLWAAVDTIRLARGGAGVGIGILGMLLAFFHFGALLALCLFLFMLAEGGPRL